MDVLENGRPWYSKVLDRCSECYSFGRLRGVMVDEENNPYYSFECNNKCNKTKYFNNIGVASCEWNKLQRKIKKDKHS